MTPEIPVPPDLTYSRNHMWIDIGEDGSCNVGVDAFMAQVLESVERVHFLTGSGYLRPRVVLAAYEASFSLTFPRQIQILGSNALLRSTPRTLTEDPYGSGWLFEGSCPEPDKEAAVESANHYWIRGPDAPLWMEEEIRRMSEFLQETASRKIHDGGRLMADGGVFVGHLVSLLEEDDLHELRDRFFPLLGEI